MCELFCRSLKGLSFCVNFFELISGMAMVYTCGVPECTTGYKSNKRDKKLLYLDFPQMKILERNELRLYLDKYGKLVKVTKCVHSILTTSSDNHDKQCCHRDNQTLKRL